VPNLPGDYYNHVECLDDGYWRNAGTMRAGDIIIFNHKTVHRAPMNTSNQYRYSIDLRVSYKQ
jgi:ectoine hydroxylase-related dioxygenase (phytanoyl-CoA dioxygenase family)